MIALGAETEDLVQEWKREPNQKVSHEIYMALLKEFHEGLRHQFLFSHTLIALSRRPLEYQGHLVEIDPDLKSLI